MMRYALLLSLSLLLASCSFSDKDGALKAEKAVLPDIVLEKARYVLVQEDQDPMVLQSQRMEIYTKDNRAIALGLSFEQSDGNGAVIMKGEAERATIDLGGKSIAMEGGAWLERNGEMRIEADDLLLDTGNETAKVRGKASVETDEADIIGYGFDADLKLLTYRFSEIEKGTLK